MPKTPETRKNVQESIKLHRTVDKVIIHRPATSGRNAPNRHLRQSYQKIENTASQTGGETQVSPKVVHTDSDIDRLRAVRQGFKAFAEETRKKVVTDIEAQCQKKLDEALKLESLTNFGRELLSDVGNMRQQTDSLLQQTLARCRSLCDQITQTEERANNLDSLEKSIDLIIQDLKR